MKYIHINAFIKLSKELSTSELLTFLGQNLTTDLSSLLSFYSQRQIRSNLKKLKALGYLEKKFKDLTSQTNNLLRIDADTITKHQKQSILFYKYKIFELFCTEYILVKQEQIKRHLNITQDEIYKFKKLYSLDANKRSLKLKGLTKWQLGLEDRNIANSHYYYTSLPNQYIFYNCTDSIRFKCNDEFIIDMRKKLAFGYSMKEYDYSSLDPDSQKLSLTNGNVNITDQLARTYTKIIEETSKYTFKLEKQLTNMFPFFVKRNNIQKFYKKRYLAFV